MSAEMISELAPASRAGRTAGMVRPVLGMLADGTAYFAPVGAVVIDAGRVTCHLCGRRFRSVTAHLPFHGWTKEQYCAAFGLERGQSLEGPETRKLRSAAFTARLVFEPAVREGSAAGRARAASGELARDAAAAARGRPFPEQRRKKAVRAGTAGSPARLARASRERADKHLAVAAADAAARCGFDDIGSLVKARLAAGDSLATISREAGLHKDWLSRHLHRIDPAAAAAARRRPGEWTDPGWLAAMRPLGYQDVAAYLRARHLEQHRTVNAIAAEIGVSHHAVAAALARHGLASVPHAAKRHAAEQRATAVAERHGYARIADYVAERRGAGWTWNAIAAESGQPQTWLRRHAR